MLAAAPLTRERNDDPEVNAPFIEAFLCELHSEALSIAMVASAASSLQRLDITMDVGFLNNEAPDSGPLLDLLTCARLGEAGGLDDVAGLEEYIDALTRGEASLSEFTRDVRTIGYRRAATLHAIRMTETWFAACKAVEKVVTSSFDAAPARCHDIYRENVSVLCSLLRSAASGMRPCLDDRHKLVKPLLPQQRRWPRKSMMEDCQLALGERLFNICIVDISAGGAGLAHTPPLEEGQPVAVVLHTGRTLSGSVVWMHDGQAGMQFSKPLRANDLLLQN